jgi:integrase
VPGAQNSCSSTWNALSIRSVVDKSPYHSETFATGAVFRSINRHGRIGATAITAQVVALVVKRWCKAAGLDAARFSAHSLRSGLATQAARNGASERAIMRQIGHKSVQMVRRYIREGELFNDNAAGKLGL